MLKFRYALVDDDKSVVTCMAVILTFVMMDLGLSALKRRSGAIERIAEAVPVVLVDQGRFVEPNLLKTHVTHSDIMQAARLAQGLERFDQIKYALLKTSGGISIIPVESDRESRLEKRIEEAVRRALDAPRRPGSPG